MYKVRIIKTISIKQDEMNTIPQLTEAIVL